QLHRSSTLLLKQLSSPISMVVIGSLPSSLHPSPLPLRFRPPPDPPPCLPCPMSFEALSPPLSLSPPEPPDPPDASCRLFVHLHVDTPFTLSQAFSKIRNLETPFPNLTSGGVVSFVFFGATRIGSKCLYPAVCNVLLADVLFGVVTVLLPFISSPQALIHISTLKPPSRMATKNVEWFRQLFVWLMLEFRFMILAGDRPMGLVSFGSTFATSSSIYIALARSFAVCSSLTGSISDVGVVFVYLCSWWQVEEKPIVTFIPMNMEVAGYSPLVPRLSQSYFLIFTPIWSELDEQASLVLQRSSS
ncbi:unnamed protein product, partial [Brassica napus]